jgi:hypothetical protein
VVAPVGLARVLDHILIEEFILTMTTEENDFLHKSRSITAEKIVCPSCNQKTPFIVDILVGADTTKKANIFLLFGYVSVVLFLASIASLAIISFTKEEFNYFTDSQAVMYDIILGIITAITFLYLALSIAILEILRISISSCSKYVSLANVKEKLSTKFIFNPIRASIFDSFGFLSKLSHNDEWSFYGGGLMKIEGKYGCIPKI